jgi:nucleotide-binding universal stress UspA family protein
MTKQTIVIAVPLEDELLTPLYRWGSKFDFGQIKHIHLIHVVKKNISPLEFGLVESPDELTYQDMLPTLYRFLKDEATKIVPQNFLGKTTFEVTKNFEPLSEVINSLNDLKADLIVVSMHDRHGLAGLFHLSFTESLIKKSPCDVLVLRPHIEEESRAS